MSKEKINYPQELVKSLKRENALLFKDNQRLEGEVKGLKLVIAAKEMKGLEKFLKDKKEQKENVKNDKNENVNQQKPLNDETSPRDFSKPIWRKFHFKNGKDYELALANDDGVLVFRDSIFEAPFDDKDDWNKCTNEWEKCTLKEVLEKWWEENAPQVLKDNYTITIPEAYNIFPDELLPQDLKGKNQHWEIYKDWRNRIFGHHEQPRSTWVWTKTKHPSYARNVRLVYTDGSLGSGGAYYSSGVVPACVPISSEAKSQNLECGQHDLQEAAKGE